MKRFVAYLCMALLAWGCLVGAAAETERGDLTARFSSDETLVYQGVTYRLKNRMTAMVMAVTDRQAAPQEAVWLLGMLAVDDAQKQMHVLLMDPAVYLQGAVGEEGPRRGEVLLDLLNALLPHRALERYLLLDVQGLDLLDGGAAAAAPETTRSRLQGIRTWLEEKSSAEWLTLLEALSGYMETDLQPGALIRIGEKAKDYQVLPAVLLPVCGGAIPEGEELLPLYIPAFYEEKIR